MLYALQPASSPSSALAAGLDRRSGQPESDLKHLSQQRTDKRNLCDNEEGVCWFASWNPYTVRPGSCRTGGAHTAAGLTPEQPNIGGPIRPCRLKSISLRIVARNIRKHLIRNQGHGSRPILLPRLLWNNRSAGGAQSFSNRASETK